MDFRDLSQSSTFTVFWDKNLSQIKHSDYIWDNNLHFSSITLHICHIIRFFYHTFTVFQLSGIKIYTRFASDCSFVINREFCVEITKPEGRNHRVLLGIACWLSLWGVEFIGDLSQSSTFTVFWDKNLSQIKHSDYIWDNNLHFSSIILHICHIIRIFYHTFTVFQLSGIRIYPRFASDCFFVINCKI